MPLMRVALPRNRAHTLQRRGQGGGGGSSQAHFSKRGACGTTANNGFLNAYLIALIMLTSSESRP